MAAYARVYVWLPKGTLTHGLGIGHGAVKIKTPENKKYYITWLNNMRDGCLVSGVGGGFLSQKTEASKKVGFAMVRGTDGKTVPNPDALGSSTTMNFARDRRVNANRFPELGLDEVPPNYHFDVPVDDPLAIHAGDNLFGVSVHRMERFWKRLMLLPPGHRERRYAALSTHKNCNGVTVDALLAGGLGLFARPPRNLIYQDARTLVEWVEKATQRINEMNDQHREIIRLLGKRSGSLGTVNRTVPTFEQWKKDSDRGIAFYARRKEQIEQIDMYLRLYQRAVREKKQSMQAAFLFLLQTEIYSHLTRKPTSDRRQAVLNLAKSVLCAIQDLFGERDESEDDGIRFDRNPGSEIEEILDI